MNLTLLRCGERALLAQVQNVGEVMALTAALRADAEFSAAVTELVPAARTILIETADGADLRALRHSVSRIARNTETADARSLDTTPIEIPVRYDGPDLAEVAAAAGLSTKEVIGRHTAGPWRAAFGGFAPGFAYLIGGPPELQVPRRRESRTAVPAGSVALAGEYSAVYPAESPGGWQLIGTTEVALWDVGRDPPALIRPGTLVRFVELSGDDARMVAR